MRAKITTRIRKQYPHPITYDSYVHDIEEDSYCVGGGVCQYFLGKATSDLRRFPTTTRLAEYLMQFNPHLPLDRAQDLAACITGANDKGHFRKAWAYAEEALTYRPEGETHE